MDPLDANFIPPPAYSEEEFDQKVSRATELSLELAKWETPKVEIDEEGFPRYDPSMFEERPRVQKGKDQSTTATFRSSSISKRPLPNPKSASSSTDAGPSTLRQTQPLHISKKSISKAEEAATRDIPASYPSLKYTPEDIPPYAAQNIPVTPPGLQSVPGQIIEDTSEDNPPYTAIDPHVSTASSIEDAPEDNPPYTAMDLHVSTSSFSNQIIEDTVEDNPPYEHSYPAEPPYDEQPRLENWEEGTTPRQEAISEPVPDNRPQSPGFELPEHLRQGDEGLTPNTATMANQMLNRQSQYSLPPNHRGPQLSNPNTATTANQMLNRQSQYSLPPIHHGPQSSNPNTTTMSNRMLDTQSQYSMAPNPPVHRGPQQHFSLPPAPRTLSRILPSDRPRSQSTIPTSPSSSLSQPTAPRVVFNPNVAYGKSAMGGQVPQFRPKPQTPQTPRYDPTTFYK